MKKLLHSLIAVACLLAFGSAWIAPISSHRRAVPQGAGDMHRTPPGTVQLALLVVGSLQSMIQHKRQFPFCHYQLCVTRTRTRLKAKTNKPAATTAKDDNAIGDDARRIRGITLKIAVDSQGGVADLAASQSDRFTSPSSLDRVHRLRRDAQAILIGRRTVAFDDPSLTIRRHVQPPSTPPLRVVLDARLDLLIHRVEQGRRYQLFEDGLPTLVYHALDDVDEESLNLLESVKLVQVPMDNKEKVYAPTLDVHAIWDNLQHDWGVTHLMVEGGPAVARSFLQAGLVDRVVLVRAESVTFREPIPSGITRELLKEVGLQCLGEFDEDDDTTECWVRPGTTWPSEALADWP